MQPVLKEGKAVFGTQQINPLLNKQKNKDREAAKPSKYSLGFKSRFTVINMQEDEDAAVRPDIWN